jgi:hypothetical protein
MRIGVFEFFFHELPRRFAFFGGIFPGQIEQQQIVVCLPDEVLTVGKTLYFIELAFHKIMDCLDVGLKAVASRRDRSMLLPLYRLDGFGEFGILLGLP